MITDLSAAELARRIRSGALSPVDAVEAHIARIEQVNPRLNAVVTPRYAEARAEARAAQDALARGAPVGPLHGVPVTIKDSLDVAGTRATAGLASRAHRVPERDADVVARLRGAGAVVLAKTNTPDNCGDQETDSVLFGRTNNPWDPARTVGGSSGGEAAIIAAGGSPLGVGSDISGSIRMPAHFTGVVGLRPTSGRLSEVGHWPFAAGRLADLEAVGPMARTVEDVALAFDVMAGEPPHEVDVRILRGERVAWWLDGGLLPASAAVRAGVRAAADSLARAGMVPVAGAPRRRWMATAGWVGYVREAEREAFARGFGGGERWRPGAELGRLLAGRGRVAPGALQYWLGLHYGSLLLGALGVDGAAWRERLRAEVLALIGAGGVAVAPIFPTSAPPHGWTFAWLALLTTLPYQQWVNLAGLPGLTVPVGRTRGGLPFGVQIVGAPEAERVVLAAGLAVERALRT